MEIYQLLALILIFIILTQVAIYFIAKNLNNKHLLNYPDYKSYTWGYFQGIGFIFYGVISFLVNFLTLFLNNNTEATILLIGSLSLSTFAVFLGYFVCQKEKWSFVLITISNPLFWIINYLYIKRRPYLAKNYDHDLSQQQKEEKSSDKNIEIKQAKKDIVYSDNGGSQSNSEIEAAKQIQRLINKEITVEEYENIKIKTQENSKGKESVSSSALPTKENNYIDKLRGAKELLDSGAINPAEFEKLKQKIMSEL